MTFLRSEWDRVAGWALIGVGAILLTAAGLGAQGATYVPDSLSFLMSGGFGGLASEALGLALLLSAGFHDEWRKLDGVEGVLRSQGSGPAPAADPAGSGQAVAVTPFQWIRAEWDRVAAWLLVAGAFVWLIVGARLVADSLFAPKQVAQMISGGVGAMVLLAIGVAGVLLADVRDEGHKLARLKLALEGRALPEAREALTGGLVLAADDLPAGRRDASLFGRWTVLGAIAFLAGVAVVGLGWWRAADAVETNAAMEGLVLAVTGLGLSVVVLAGEAVWLRHRLAVRARCVLSPVRRREKATSGQDEVLAGTVQLWTAAGLHHVHQASCPALVHAGGELLVVSPATTVLETCLLCDEGDPADA